MGYLQKLSYNFQKWLGIVVFVVVACLLTYSSPTNAQTSDSQLSLSISPIIFDFSANPGDKIENTLKVTNTHGTGPITVNMEVKPFTGTETGEAQILEEDDPAYSLGKWVTLTPESFILDPGENQLVKFTVNIPASAEPGGRYASILAKTANGGLGTTGAVAVQKVGSLILVKVNGAITYNALVKDFKTVTASERIEDAQDRATFENGPVTFFARLSNTGTSHIRPRGFVTISNMFGNKVGEDVVFPERNVLPGNDRVIEAIWEKARPGYYTATLILNYGDQNEQLTATTTFLVFPWKTGIPIALGILVALWFLTARRKRIIKALSIIFSRH